MISNGMSGSGKSEKYNCYENVKKIIELYQFKVNHFILSTWDDQDFIYDHPKLHLVKSKNPGLQSTLSSQRLTSDFLQSYGVYSALLFCKKNLDQDYVIKVRTDQYIDVNKLINHMIYVDEEYDDYKCSKQSGFIYFPNALSWSPYSVGDFYVGGHIQDLLNFYESQVSLRDHSMSNIFPWVHSEIIFKYSYKYLREVFNLSDYHYFPNLATGLRHDIYPRPFGLTYSLATLKLWEKLIQNSICLFPSDVAMTLVWRGEKIDKSAHSSGAWHYEEWLEARRGVFKWYLDNYPYLFKSEDKLYFGKSIFLNFSSEKIYEIENGKIIIYHKVKSFFRNIIFLSLLRYPVSNIHLKIWIKIYVIIKKYILDLMLKRI